MNEKEQVELALDNMEKNVKTLEKELKGFKAKTTELSNTLLPSTKFDDPDLSNEAVEQLIAIGDLGRNNYREAVINQSPFKLIVAENLLETLMDKNFIFEIKDDEGNRFISLTDKGTSKLLNLTNYSKRKPMSKDDIPF